MLLYNVLNVFNLLSCLEILGLCFYGLSFAMCALSGRNITRLLIISHLIINFYEELSAPRHGLVTGAQQGLLPSDSCELVTKYPRQLFSGREEVVVAEEEAW